MFIWLFINSLLVRIFWEIKKVGSAPLLRIILDPPLILIILSISSNYIRYSENCDIHSTSRIYIDTTLVAKQKIVKNELNLSSRAAKQRDKISGACSPDSTPPGRLWLKSEPAALRLKLCSVEFACCIKLNQCAKYLNCGAQFYTCTTTQLLS